MTAPVVVVGSVAWDSIETPFGKAESVLGGSANFFSLGCSFFSPVQMVAVVGDDFPEDHLTFLRSKNIDTSGVTRAAGKTFRWKGKYGFDLNSAQTLDTQLNVFQNFEPKLPPLFREAPYLFLGNIDPVLQLQVLDQMTSRPLVALDTMNLWLDTKRDDVLRVLKRVDIITINDSEARMLAGTPWLVSAARKIRQMGPRVVVIKKGEHGALLFLEDGSIFSAPALPLEEVKDPTGAGDTFAAGFFGSLASQGTKLGSPEVLKRSVIYGSVMASFTVEDFSFKRLMTLTNEEIARRFDVFRRLTHFE